MGFMTSFPLIFSIVILDIFKAYYVDNYTDHYILRLLSRLDNYH